MADKKDPLNRDPSKAKQLEKGITGTGAPSGPGFIKAVKGLFGAETKPNAQYENKKQRGYGQQS